MEESASKAIQSFLNLFRMDIYTKGSILALENTMQNKAFIVVKGDVFCYKKLFSLESHDCIERK